MKNLAPQIKRQRLLIEGYYTVDVDKKFIINYFQQITQALNLRMYGEPIIFSPAGEGKDVNQGYDAFVPLIDSGISVYVWSNEKFLSLIIYTCKSFDENLALEVTKVSWGLPEMASNSF